MLDRRRWLVLISLALAAALLYLFQGLQGNWEYALPKRLMKAAAMVLTGIAIAYATVVFQTVTNSRILTPSMIGLDSLYVLIQTAILFFFGASHSLFISRQVNFALSIALMAGLALLLYRFLFKDGQRSVYMLLLAGIIAGTFFGSLTTFFEVLIDPNEFLQLQSRLFASFNNMAGDLLLPAGLVMAAGMAWGSRFYPELDALSLGREAAIGLGVDYEKVVRTFLLISAVLVAAATALVGPITFFGIIVANLSYEYFKTYRHTTLIAGASLIGVIALLGGQWLVERAFRFGTTLSVIINFAGGLYFIALLLKERKTT